ncbi:MAG: hypothetical protein ACPGLY_11935 [Rubripirellula sp.]
MIGVLILADDALFFLHAILGTFDSLVESGGISPNDPFVGGWRNLSDCR